MFGVCGPRRMFLFFSSGWWTCLEEQVIQISVGTLGGTTTTISIIII